jgi:hypothetical protein
VLVLELTCRIEDWVEYRAPLLSRYSSLSDLIITDAYGMHGRANAQYLKWSMNSMGTRGPDVPVKAKPGTIRVMTVGASETFGLRESPNHEYPRQLEDSLNARAARGECSADRALRFEVVNAAFPGMTLPTIEQDIRLRLRPLEPSIVVIYPTPAQYLQDEAPNAPRPDTTASTTEPSLFRALRPRSLGRLRDQVKAILPEWVIARAREFETRRLLQDEGAGGRFTSVPADRLSRMETDLRQLIGTVRGLGATPVLVTHGNVFMGRKPAGRDDMITWEKAYPRATGQTIMTFDSTARFLTLRVGADAGVQTVDAAHRLSAAPESAFGDFVHFSDLGASNMADVVSAGVLRAARERGACKTESTLTSGPDLSMVKR